MSMTEWNIGKDKAMHKSDEKSKKGSEFVDVTQDNDAVNLELERLFDHNAELYQSFDFV